MKLIFVKIFWENCFFKDRGEGSIGEGPWSNDDYNELYLPNTI